MPVGPKKMIATSNLKFCEFSATLRKDLILSPRGGTKGFDFGGAFSALHLSKFGNVLSLKIEGSEWPGGSHKRLQAP